MDWILGKKSLFPSSSVFCFPLEPKEEDVEGGEGVGEGSWGKLCVVDAGLFMKDVFLSFLSSFSTAMMGVSCIASSLSLSDDEGDSSPPL